MCGSPGTSIKEAPRPGGDWVDSPTMQGWENWGLFPFLVLSVRDDVANVLVVHIASYIWRESVPHVLDLRGEEEH